jgi:hypothetical protein
VGRELAAMSMGQLELLLEQLTVADRRLVHFDKVVKSAVMKGECPVLFLQLYPFQGGEEDDKGEEDDEEEEEEEEVAEAKGKTRV